MGIVYPETPFDNCRQSTGRGSRCSTGPSSARSSNKSAMDAQNSSRQTSLLYRRMYIPQSPRLLCLLEHSYDEYPRRLHSLPLLSIHLFLQPSRVPDSQSSPLAFSQRLGTRTRPWLPLSVSHRVLLLQAGVPATNTCL